MASRDVTADAGGIDEGGPGAALRSAAQRLTTETKAFFKTTRVVDLPRVRDRDTARGNSIEGEEGGRDFFAADRVWLYITLLTIGYLISRGIAKAGVRDPYYAERGDRNADH